MPAPADLRPPPRYCLAKGVRPHALSDIILAMHTERNSRDYIRRERDIEMKPILNAVNPVPYTGNSNPHTLDHKPKT